MSQSDGGVCDEEDGERCRIGASTEEWGNPVYPPARRKLAENGICCEGKTARQMSRADYDYYDLIIAMDHSNLRGIQRIIGADFQNKVSLLMDHTDHYPGAKFLADDVISVLEIP